jgi:hypothetical protein
MRDYADLSFEELRLQYNKYTCSKQTGYFLHGVVAFYVLDCILVTSLYCLLYKAIDKEIPCYKVESHLYT